MPVPPSILVRQEPDSPTHSIGTYGGLFRRKQFFACVVATLPDGKLPADWRSQKRWYAILHHFDHSGRHLRTEHYFAGTSADGEDRVIAAARQHLQSFMSALPRTRLEDIVIYLFAVAIDGSQFGLVDASDPADDYEAIHLIPNDLAFFSPWQGDYDT